jgi:hypothetical protein
VAEGEWSFRDLDSLGDWNWYGRGFQRDSAIRV